MQWARSALRGLGWRELAGTVRWPDGGSVADGRRQAGSGRARNRAKARLNWFSQGQRWGRCRVRRRAERVSRPAREKKRRRRVLVVTSCSPRPMRTVQRAITCTASQAPLAAQLSRVNYICRTHCLNKTVTQRVDGGCRWHTRLSLQGGEPGPRVARALATNHGTCERLMIEGVLPR